uniref:Protein TSS n=1 Tax=Tanacetum cinerariifolium TaxID=118510 RepID=A0A6L2J9G3_TANCI|nr:protein TSS [Tanacetum cinerariifolium]
MGNLAESQPEASATENESALKKLVSDVAAFTRLKESKTGLHRTVYSVELIDQSQKYDNEGSLIAHRSRLHPGTRYLARGLDSCYSTGTCERHQHKRYHYNYHE